MVSHPVVIYIMAYCDIIINSFLCIFLYFFKAKHLILSFFTYYLQKTSGFRPFRLKYSAKKERSFSTSPSEKQ